MTFGSYKQYDSRWGKKNYNGSSNYSQAACGPTSCANILYAIDSSITPVTTGTYMQKNGFAIRNNGTAWSGIPACLKHFGAKDVQSVNVSTSMTKVWELMKKGYVGVFLFRAGTRSNITWTTSGHYLAVTGYKYKNNKHYLRMVDSGGRDHDGWYCYETQMRGLIPRVWLCTVKEDIEPVDKPTGKYDGDIPKPTLKNGNDGDDVKALQKFLTWYGAGELTADGIFGNATEKAQKVWQTTEGLEVTGCWGSASYNRGLTYEEKNEIIDTIDGLAWAYGTPEKKWKYKTGSARTPYKEALKKYMGKTEKISLSDCGYFINTVIRKCGIDDKFVALPSGSKKPYPYSDKFNVVFKGKKIPDGTLLAGDIIRYRKTTGAQHVLFYYGDGKIAEAGRKTRFPVIRKDEGKYNKSNVKKATIEVLRQK